MSGPAVRPEREVPAPLAVCRGREGLDATVAVVTWALPALLGLATWFVLRAAPLGVVPLAANHIARTPASMAVVAGLGYAVLGLARCYTFARAGEAHVHPDRVVIVRDVPRVVFLREVTSFEDASGDVVHLHVAAGPTAAVPTGGEDRTALLAALDAAGIPRRDAGPRAISAAPAPVLVVEGARGLLDHAAIPLAIVLAVTIAMNLLATYALLALPIAAFLWLARREPGFGTARLFDDRVELAVWSALSPRPPAVAWDDVVGWEVGSPNHLLLRLRPGSLREAFKSGVPVPTPDDAARAALVAQLTTRGIPRVA